MKSEDLSVDDPYCRLKSLITEPVDEDVNIAKSTALMSMNVANRAGLWSLWSKLRTFIYRNSRNETEKNFGRYLITTSIASIHFASTSQKALRTRRSEITMC